MVRNFFFKDFTRTLSGELDVNALRSDKILCNFLWIFSRYTVCNAYYYTSYRTILLPPCLWGVSNVNHGKSERFSSFHTLKICERTHNLFVQNLFMLYHHFFFQVSYYCGGRQMYPVSKYQVNGDFFVYFLLFKKLKYFSTHHRQL